MCVHVSICAYILKFIDVFIYDKGCALVSSYRCVCACESVCVCVRVL